MKMMVGGQSCCCIGETVQHLVSMTPSRGDHADGSVNQKASAHLQCTLYIMLQPEGLHSEGTKMCEAVDL